MSLRLAKVCAVHPEANSVDLRMYDDGSRWSNAQVLAFGASTNTGLLGPVAPDVAASGDPWDLLDSRTRDVIAIVGFVGMIPVVVGFLPPQVCQMTFADKNRMVYRHPSDVYVTIDDAGNTELYHPSGTFLRIGANGAHEDLTGRDFDGKWRIVRNTGAAVHVHLAVANAGAQVASVDIDPAGNITESNSGNLSATVGGAVTANVTGTTTVTSGGAVTVNAPSVTLNAATVHCTGQLNVDGKITGAGGFAISGGSGATAQVTGSITATGDVKAGAISLETHTHPDPQGGSTGGPQ